MYERRCTRDDGNRCAIIGRCGFRWVWHGLFDHGGKRELGFIEPYMARNINPTSKRIKTLICTLSKRVANKDTRKGSVFEFVRSIRPEPREAQATKRSQFLVVWCGMKKSLERRSV